MWLVKIFVLLLFLLATELAFSIDCELAKKLGHPSLANNKQFWQEFEKINSEDVVALKKLLEKHIPNAPAGTLVSQGVSTLRITEYAKSVVSFSSTGRKAVQKLNSLEMKKVDQFLKIINESGLQGLRDNPGKWGYKQLKRNVDEHTIRIDDGSRLLFEIKNGEIKILDAGNHVTH